MQQRRADGKADQLLLCLGVLPATGGELRPAMPDCTVHQESHEHQQQKAAADENEDRGQHAAQSNRRLRDVSDRAEPLYVSRRLDRSEPNRDHNGDPGWPRTLSLDRMRSVQ